MEIAMTPPAAPRRLAFDPVCGSPLPPLYGANPFHDADYTYYFCSAMCRRFFIDQRAAESRPQRDPGGAMGYPQIGF
jgi:YHS domain-containing protein